MTTPETGSAAEVADRPSDQDRSAHPWGRVDEHGVVFVRDHDDERQVGEYPDATPDEAIGYYERKYADLASQVGLLEQRARRGTPRVVPPILAAHPPPPRLPERHRHRPLGRQLVEL